MAVYLEEKKIPQRSVFNVRRQRDDTHGRHLRPESRQVVRRIVGFCRDDFRSSIFRMSEFITFGIPEHFSRGPRVGRRPYNVIFLPRFLRFTRKSRRNLPLVAWGTPAAGKYQLSATVCPTGGTKRQRSIATRRWRQRTEEHKAMGGGEGRGWRPGDPATRRPGGRRTEDGGRSPGTRDRWKCGMVPRLVATRSKMYQIKNEQIRSEVK